MRTRSSGIFMSEKETGFYTMVVITECLTMKNNDLKGVFVTNSFPVNYVQLEMDGNGIRQQWSRNVSELATEVNKGHYAYNCY